MWEHDVRRVFARLPKSAMPFDYFKDRYALMLLRDALPGEVPIRALRASRYARLLHRPAVQALIGHRGNGRLGPADLDLQMPGFCENYELTLGLWGEGRRTHWSRAGYQMARRGWNLVLQLITFRRRMCGRTARVTFITPNTLVSNIARMASSLACSNTVWPP